MNAPHHDFETRVEPAKGKRNRRHWHWEHAVILAVFAAAWAVGLWRFWQLAT